MAGPPAQTPQAGQTVRWHRSSLRRSSRQYTRSAPGQRHRIVPSFSSNVTPGREVGIGNAVRQREIETAFGVVRLLNAAVINSTWSPMEPFDTLELKSKRTTGFAPAASYIAGFERTDLARCASAVVSLARVAVHRGRCVRLHGGAEQSTAYKKARAPVVRYLGSCAWSVLQIGANAAGLLPVTIGAMVGLPKMALLAETGTTVACRARRGWRSPGQVVRYRTAPWPPCFAGSAVPGFLFRSVSIA